jgi:hypothetical protein
MLPFPLDTNRSNDSDSGSDRHNDSQSDSDSFDVSPEIMFYLLITLVIPSIICSLFLFYNFIRLPQLRTKPSNLLIICLLTINFIHVSYLSSIFTKSSSFSFIATDWSTISSIFSFPRSSSYQTSIVLSHLDMLWQHSNYNWSLCHGIYIHRAISIYFSPSISSLSQTFLLSPTYNSMFCSSNYLVYEFDIRLSMSTIIHLLYFSMWHIVLFNRFTSFCQIWRLCIFHVSIVCDCCWKQCTHHLCSYAESEYETSTSSWFMAK